MRIFAVLGLLVSCGAFAQSNSCDKYRSYDRYMKAIEAVAQELDRNVEELCTDKNIWDVEAQPSRVVSREGIVVPHTRVQLHYKYDSCLFMVRDKDLEITSQRCYSGF